jgi:hypothetical protein
METSYRRSGLALHVFELVDGRHWAVAVDRFRGVGQKIVAYSDVPCESEAQAHIDGRRAFDAAQCGTQGA